MLDDGTIGLQAIEAYGGVALVQDLNEADEPEMPRSSLQYVQVDDCMTLDGHDLAIEETVWAAVRALHEKQMLQRLAASANQPGREQAAEEHEASARALASHAEVLRAVLTGRQRKLMPVCVWPSSIPDQREQALTGDTLSVGFISAQAGTDLSRRRWCASCAVPLSRTAQQAGKFGIDREQNEVSDSRTVFERNSSPKLCEFRPDNVLFLDFRQKRAGIFAWGPLFQ